VQDIPRLIYNMATEKWLFGSQDDFWNIRATSDAMSLANFMQIHVIDQSSSDYLIVAKGFADITDQGETDCQVTLTPFKQGNQRDVTIFPEAVDFGLVDCLFGLHEDQWVETEAIFGLEDIRSLALKFYLPDSEDLGDKVINCFVGDKRIQTATIKRGEEQEVWMDIPEGEEKRQELVVKAEYMEPNATDERSLGMIFTEYNPNLTEWVSAKELF